MYTHTPTHYYFMMKHTEIDINTTGEEIQEGHVNIGGGG